MLRLLGIHGNPALRALVGAAVLALGIGIHWTMLMLVGGALVVWGGAGALSSLSRRNAVGPNDRRSR